MCGIFSLLNNDSHIFNYDFIQKQFEKGTGRGPEFSKLEQETFNTILGFHRLAINGLNSESNQPIVVDHVRLICNGEIYNYRELYAMMNITPTTDSDCEVIIHLYMRYGIEQTLQMLDGVFSFILVDCNIYGDTCKLYIARDPYGVRPLYTLKTNNIADIYRTSRDEILGFASEVKVLIDFRNALPHYIIEHFSPGTYSFYERPFSLNSLWKATDESIKYHTPGFNSIMYAQCGRPIIYKNIQDYLVNAVNKRAIITDRPIACLLSGGLDSSLITALVNDIHKKVNDSPLETYSIGLEGSEDLRCAKIVATYLNTRHTEIIVTEDDFLNAIPEVIATIESYDTTTVRASIGNYLLGKYISENSEAKVIFNGDGSDELCGGYLYMHKCPDSVEFDKESRRLLKDIHLFDVLRSDKCISSHGLEPRTPFLDRSWVQYYLSICPTIRNHNANEQCEKFLLRTAFSKEYYTNSGGEPLLPDEILWRTKEAFSDGVSKQTRSLYEIIQDHVKNTMSVHHIDLLHASKLYTINKPTTQEQFYYRNIFSSHYPDMDNIIPYFWMPRYVEATDASARTLNIYKEINRSHDE